MRNAIKEAERIIVGGDKKSMAEMLSKAYKEIDKARKRGVIKKNTASRKKSRIAKKVEKINKK